MKVALVHDYFFQAGGAERVMAVLHEMFPTAPIYTTVLRRETLWPGLRDADIRTSWLQPLLSLPIPARALLPLYPSAIESLDLSEYDLVISNSSSFAKSVIVREGAVHLCYCHTPMRFAWSDEAYLNRERFGAVAKLALRPLLAYMRRWDYRTRHRPTVYLGNSSAVVDRIRATYQLPADVMHPPVDMGRCYAAPQREDFYLVVSRLAPYKRIDLAVEAFNRLGKRLVVIGDGPDAKALRRMAGPTIELLGRLPDEEVARYYATARGFILPGEEDFGITPLEANASGCPAIAYRAGGALDTVIDGETGVHFARPDATSLAEAVQRSEQILWNPRALRAHADQFSEPAFKARMFEAIDRALAGHRPSRQRDASAA
ncbi:MAG: glycosyltransferase, partial [Cytophagaceae bacterium]|nr:glycosyltransferase [Gemmatimonadaceae bacterium]